MSVKIRGSKRLDDKLASCLKRATDAEVDAHEFLTEVLGDAADHYVVSNWDYAHEMQALDLWETLTDGIKRGIELASEAGPDGTVWFSSVQPDEDGDGTYGLYFVKEKLRDVLDLLERETAATVEKQRQDRGILPFPEGTV